MMKSEQTTTALWVCSFATQECLHLVLQYSKNEQKKNEVCHTQRTIISKKLKFFHKNLSISINIDYRANIILNEIHK